MEITKLLRVKDRKAWRKWLAKNHDKEKDIWLVYYKKESGKKRIPYNDAVEEALCYGWIDSTIKTVDSESNAQRFTPRKKNSPLSEMNKERVRRLIESKKMTKFGLESISHDLDKEQTPRKFKLPADITMELKKNPVAWKNFRNFPESYKHIRIGWIEGARKRPDAFKTRLNYFIRMTEKNKMYGMVR